MYKAQKNLWFLLVTTLALSLTGCKGNYTVSPSSLDDNLSPFLIEVVSSSLVEEPEEQLINNELVLTGRLSKRLILVVEINNTLNRSFNKVKYSLKLNDEAQPFIASGITTRESDLFYVLAKGKKAGSTRNGLVEVIGFEDKWGLLITAESDLSEYAGLTFNDIYNHVKALTVLVTWEGGQQEEIFPLNLKGGHL